jgi:hypothetical protein
MATPGRKQTIGQLQERQSRCRIVEDGDQEKSIEIKIERRIIENEDCPKRGFSGMRI